MKKHFAEVIESSLTNFLGQSWVWDKFPNFGSLVEVQSGSDLILGIVTDVKTGSLDPLRYPFAYQKTEEELKAEQPQIFEFLKTSFNVQVVGSRGNGKFSTFIPSRPCKIHSFISECDRETNIQFFEKPDFLHLLFSFESKISNLDELLLAILRNLAQENALKKETLEQFCKIFSLLSGNDYRRLKIFLSRVENL